MRLKLVLIFLLTIGIGPLHAESSQCSLYGLKNISVEVDLSDADKRTHVDSDGIKYVIEHRLTDCGLKISPDGAKLKITLTTVDIPTINVCSFSLRLELSELSIIKRIGSQPVRVITWSEIDTGSDGYDNFADDMKPSISQLMDEFTSSYQKDNPTITSKNSAQAQ
jgi:hypothetical protein